MTDETRTAHLRTNVMQPTREELLTLAMHQLARPIPSTKGMDPKARADRLHAELARRIKLAKQALHPSVAGMKT